MLTLSRLFEFSASHRLFRPDWDDQTNFKIFGKCANPGGHGHNYQLEVTISGVILPETDMIMDAAVLKALVEDLIIKGVDHRNLNSDVAWLKGRVPTVEVICNQIWDRLFQPISKSNPQVALHRVKLWETSRIYASKGTGL